MENRLYNTYSYGDDLTLFELDKKNIKGKEYLLLLQKQSPNLMFIAFFEDDSLQIVKNKVISNELFKIFMEDKKAFYEKLKPFINFSKVKVVKK